MKLGTGEVGPGSEFLFTLTSDCLTALSNLHPSTDLCVELRTFKASIPDKDVWLYRPGPGVMLFSFVFSGNGSRWWKAGVRGDAIEKVLK